MQRKNLGRILGVIGLVILLSSSLTFLIGATNLALAKAIVGSALIIFYFVTNFRNLGNTATSRGTFFVAVTAVSSLLVLGLLTVANYFAIKNPKTWDMTKNQIHTLAPDTTKTLKGLQSDVMVTAFYSSGEQEYGAFKGLFEKYQHESTHFKYEFVDPIKNPIKLKSFNVRASGPRVVVKLGNTESRVQDPTEEALTNALVKVTHSSSKKVYFTTGHGEADLDDSQATGLSQIKKRMEDEGLKAEKINLASVQEIPSDANGIVIAGPSKAFLPGESGMVKNYLDQGGKAFIMVEPQVTSGLEDLLQAYQIAADDAVVVDPVSRLFGASESIPIVQKYNTSLEITRDFKLNTVFPTARPLSILKGTETKAQSQPVALSMPSAWGETNPTGQVKRDENEKGGPFPLVTLATLNTKEVEKSRSEEARLVVSGDRDFVTNKFYTAFGNEDFFMNCLSWITGQTERITIRPRTRDASRLFLTPAQQSTISFLAIDFVPVALIAFGLAVWLGRRSR